MARSRGKAALAAVCALAVVLTSAPAFARKRVVVLDFTGPRAGPAKTYVARLLKRRYTVVPTATWKKKAKRMRVRRLNDRNVARVAAQVQVDAVVTGNMRRKGARWYLTVMVREGRSGDVLETIKVPLRGPRVDNRARGELQGRLMPAVARAEPISGDSRTVARTDDRPERVDRGYGDSGGGYGGDSGGDSGGGDSGGGYGGGSLDDEPAPGIEQDQGGGDSGYGSGSADASGSGGDDANTTVSRSAGRRSARDTRVDVGAGVSFVGRHMTFNYTETVPDANRPWGYDGSPVPGAYIYGELYPGAFVNAGKIASGVGLAFVLDRVFYLKSRLDSSSGGDGYGTSQTRYGVGLRYRWNFGAKDTLPTVKLAAGYNGLSFSIDSGDTTIDLPDVSYSYLDLGAGARIPLGTPQMAIILDGRFLMVLSTGDMESADNYGSGSVNGVEFDGGLEFRPLKQFSIRVGGRYQRMGYTFDGTGAKAMERDADPTTKDVYGALDVYYGGYLLGMYVF